MDTLDAHMIRKLAIKVTKKRNWEYGLHPYSPYFRKTSYMQNILPNGKTLNWLV